MMIEYKKMIVVDKVLKITLCLMLVFIFTIMKPKQEVEAAVSIVPWVAGVLGGLVIDIAIDQGVTFANKQAEKDFKNKIVTKVWNSYSSEILKLKPTKLETLKWAFKAPKWLMMVISDAVADTVEDLKGKSKTQEKYMSEWGGGSSSGGGAGRKFGVDESGTPKEIPIEYDSNLPLNNPYYGTDVTVNLLEPNADWTAINVEAYNYFVKYGKVIITPISYERKNNIAMCIAQKCSVFTVMKPYIYIALNSKDQVLLYQTDSLTYPSLSQLNVTNSSVSLNDMRPAWNVYKLLLNGKGMKVFEFDSVLFFDLPRQVLELPDFVEPQRLEQIPLPNKNYETKIIEFEMPPNIIPEFELLPKNSDFEWSLIDKYIIEQGDNFYTVNYKIDYTPVINNYYTLPPAVIEEVKDSVGELIPVDKEKPNELDGSIFLYIKNFYNYFAEGITTSIDGFKQLNSSVNSIFSVFGNYFTFLPIEFRTLFFSGASMSVLLGVLYWGRK